MAKKSENIQKLSSKYSKNSSLFLGIHFISWRSILIFEDCGESKRGEDTHYSKECRASIYSKNRVNVLHRSPEKSYHQSNHSSIHSSCKYCRNEYPKNELFYESKNHSLVFIAFNKPNHCAHYEKTYCEHCYCKSESQSSSPWVLVVIFNRVEVSFESENERVRA